MQGFLAAAGARLVFGSETLTVSRTPPVPLSAIRFDCRLVSCILFLLVLIYRILLLYIYYYILFKKFFEEKRKEGGQKGFYIFFYFYFLLKTFTKNIPLLPFFLRLF